MTASKQAKELGLKPLTLTEYINQHHNGNQSRFAAAQGVRPQQITEWLNKDFIVVNGALYSPRRELIKEKE